MTSSPTKLMDTGKVTSAMFTLTLKIRPVPGKYIRSRKGLFSLCQLPLNIHYLIYEFALVEAKRRDIEHTPDCSGYSRSFKYLEPPAFLLKDVVTSEEPHRLFWDLDGYYWPREHLYRCDQRKGLGLLLASKQVHTEAAPIFWSENTSSFLSGHEVITALNHLLRPKYRDLISSISVLSTDQRGTPSNVQFASNVEQGCGPVPWDSFWQTMLRCRNLKAIEVPAVALETSPSGFHQFAIEKPALSISLVDLIPFRKWTNNLNLKTWCPFFKRIVEEEGLDEEQAAELWETGYTYTVYSDSEPSRTEPSYTEAIIGSATCHLPRAISNRRASKKVLKNKKKATRTDAENRRKEKKRGS
ncbi:hypothetical protein CSAL01_00268 [Colletotrichum salicis]|uniref:Uncharacterized protein n=1 Tax=Colletotrichum salicis TaxID=1209931 RepID=A0A135V711_9PEZI|nr:hypothetical protein CSAL01_00268 [Colletotrichum salicis]